MLKLNQMRTKILYLMLIFFALFVVATYAAPDKIDCRLSGEPCSDGKGICHSKGFCVCRAEYYG